MKIDLHCHTKQIKSGDGEKRNVTPEVFREKISNADIGIVAITNHNAFDYEQYIALRDAVSDICAVWPGVEIDIQGSNGKKFHLIVVACRNGNQTVKHLDNKQCGEKATVLFKIEKHALPGDGQTSFQILK